MNLRSKWSMPPGLMLVLHPPGILACPYCESEIGRQVSAGIFNDGFWLNAALTLLPIPVMLLIVGWIHFGTLWPKGTAKPTQVVSRGVEGRNSIPK